MGVLLLLLLAIYFLPTILAGMRDYDAPVLIFFINLLGGWTLIIWLVCIYLVFDGSTGWDF